MPLSGGRDSNLTLSYLKKYFDGKIIAYTFLSENNERDVEVAHKNAQFHNIRHILVDLRGSQALLESDFHTHE